ncbi:organomercurial lyase [Prauserella oleivorans]
MNDRTTDLAQFDQGWLAAMEQTPFVKAIIALSGLTRLGERPAPVHRLATILNRSDSETAALVRQEFTARIENGLIHWDDPYPGNRIRRVVHLGDRQVPMGSGCGPDVFTFAAVLDVPFRVEETCPTTGTPIRIDFIPGGVERMDPPEAVTVLLHPRTSATPSADTSTRSTPPCAPTSRSSPPPKRPNQRSPPAPEAAPSPSRKCSNDPGSAITATLSDR